MNTDFVTRYKIILTTLGKETQPTINEQCDKQNVRGKQMRTRVNTSPMVFYIDKFPE
jgi:hypothetical protein